MPLAARTKRRLILIALAVVVVPLLIFSIYAGAALNYAYSRGERAGVLQKFSHKGWLCKTWEGEIAMTTVPGVAPVLWTFTVRDAEVAAQVSGTVGQRVVLHYAEHRGVPTTCFGETSYFVDSVTVSP